MGYVSWNIRTSRLCTIWKYILLWIKNNNQALHFSLSRGWAGKRESGEADVRFEGAAELQRDGIWVRGSEAVHGAKRQGESTVCSTNWGDFAIFKL